RVGTKARNPRISGPIVGLAGAGRVAGALIAADTRNRRVVGLRVSGEDSGRGAIAGAGATLRGSGAREGAGAGSIRRALIGMGCDSDFRSSVEISNTALP